ncbi:MAG: LapA family protein [Nitrososphaeraceae archaeon]|nr:LapA family protein [Nitrososphaeraceae archaeon]
MRTKLIIISILFLLFAIIAVQNTIPTNINFFFWSVEVPLIVLIGVLFLIALVIGIVVGSVYERKRLNKKNTEKITKST